MARPTDPQQRLLSPHERVADDVYLALLNAADDYADGDLLVGNLNALHTAVMGVRDEELEQLRAAVERVREVAANPRSSMGRVNDYVPVAKLRAALTAPMPSEGEQANA